MGSGPRRAPSTPQEKSQFARVVDGWVSPFSRERTNQRLQLARVAWSDEAGFSGAVRKALGRPPEGIWGLAMDDGPCCDFRRPRVPEKPDWSYLWNGTEDESSRKRYFEDVQNYLQRLTHDSEDATRLGRQAFWTCMRYLEHAYLGWCDATLLSLPTSITVTRDHKEAQASLTNRRKHVEKEIRSDDPVRNADWIIEEWHAVALEQSYLDSARDRESPHEARSYVAQLEFTAKGAARELFTPNRYWSSASMGTKTADRRKRAALNNQCLSFSAWRALWSAASELDLLSWSTMTPEQREARRAEAPRAERKRSLRRGGVAPFRPLARGHFQQGTAGFVPVLARDQGAVRPGRRFDDAAVDFAVHLAWLAWPKPTGGQRLRRSGIDFQNLLSSSSPKRNPRGLVAREEE